MSLHTSDPGGELVTRFRELMRASGASVGLTAALVEVGIRHGLHLIALSGFGMDPPENAAMTALCARLLLGEPSLTLAVGGADLLSLLSIILGAIGDEKLPTSRTGCATTLGRTYVKCCLGTLHLLLMVAF